MNNFRIHVGFSLLLATNCVAAASPVLWRATHCKGVAWFNNSLEGSSSRAVVDREEAEVSVFSKSFLTIGTSKGVEVKFAIRDMGEFFSLLSEKSLSLPNGDLVWTGIVDREGPYKLAYAKYPEDYPKGEVNKLEMTYIQKKDGEDIVSLLGNFIGGSQDQKIIQKYSSAGDSVYGRCFYRGKKFVGYTIESTCGKGFGFVASTETIAANECPL